MPFINLVQTEKAYQSQQSSTFVLSFIDRNYSTNKIEITKLLTKAGLHPLKVTLTNTQQKLKKRGKGSKLIKQFRPKKFYVRLSAGELINEDTLKQINDILNPVTKIKE